MSVSVLMIVLGVVIIATRGPLIIAPARTLELYRNLVTGRPRVFGGILLLSGPSPSCSPCPVRTGQAGPHRYLRGVAARRGIAHSPDGAVGLVLGRYSDARHHGRACHREEHRRRRGSVRCWRRLLRDYDSLSHVAIHEGRRLRPPARGGFAVEGMASPGGFLPFPVVRSVTRRRRSHPA